MTDDLTRLNLQRKATAQHPLTGLTILAVEDSRFASEAVRLLAMRSGARLRRADCLASARRHLAVYRPVVVLVDLGLPDGCGSELIAELAASDVPPPVLLAMTGDPDGEARALEAGAGGVLLKPLGGIAAFQAAILAGLPEDLRPPGPRAVDDARVEPDRFALKDDLAHVAQVLEAEGPDPDNAARALDYAAQFVGSLALSAEDADLAEAARSLAVSRAGCVARSGAGDVALDAARGRLRQAVAARLADSRPI
jgi:CheY-like chemotaxis protein